MSINSFGHVLRLTTWGESHGPAIGCVVDGCPPGLILDEAWVSAGWTFGVRAHRPTCRRGRNLTRCGSCRGFTKDKRPGLRSR